MSKKHIFLRFFSKITISVCVFCAFFISPVFATLPAGYTELEYIESTGTQWIDTEYKLNNATNYEFYLDFIPLIKDSATAECGTGTSGRWSGQRWGKAIYVGNKTNYSLNENLRREASIRQQFTLKYNGTNVFLKKTQNNKTYTQTLTNVGGGADTVHSWEVFAYYYNEIGAGRSEIKLYNHWLKDGEIIVFNLIPAKRNSDGEIGMYDTVTNTFLTNQGTGDFIVGPIAHCKTFGTDGATCTECEADYILNNDGGCSEKIKIATTKMVDEEFKAAEAKLATTVQTIESVVSRTITQTGQIATLQETKQTRPDENCPANMKCLLVQDEDGTPHWYPIIEP